VKYTPFRKPQKMNAYPAPCQNPEMHMEKILGNAKTVTKVPNVVFLPLMPFKPLARRPRGIPQVTGLYKYAVRNRVSVICHRSQKSMMLVARSGELKFGGSRMPNRRAMPM